MSFDVDDWDEKFINQIIQIELDLCSKNAISNPSGFPAPNLPVLNTSSSSHLPEQEDIRLWDHPPQIVSGRGGLPFSSFAVGGGDACFSPPRELSQRFREVCEADIVGVDSTTLDTRVSRNESFRHAGLRRRNKEVERLKVELEHLSKKFMHVEQDCITLKKDRDQKNEQLKCVISQLEAKDAEIESLKRENSGSCNENRPHPATFSKLRTLQTNGSAVLELKRRVEIDDQATTSCKAQECSHSESTKRRKTKGVQTDIGQDNIDVFLQKRKLKEQAIECSHSESTKGRKTIGVQTDVGQDNLDCFMQKRILNEQAIVSNLHAIWDLYDKRSGSKLVLKLLSTCSADFFILFRCFNLSSKCDLEGLANENYSEIALHEDAQSIHSSDADKVCRFYHLLMKMRHEIAPLQNFIDALLELCNLDNVTAVQVSLRILHATLQHVAHDSCFQRAVLRVDMSMGQPNEKNFTGDEAITQEFQAKLHPSASAPSAENLSLESLLNISEAMQQIIVKTAEERVQLEGLSIMSLVAMECSPGAERDKLGSLRLLETLSALMSREVGVRVRKQAVRHMFLLLNSPKMLLRISEESDLPETDGTNNSWQAAIKSMLENIAECLTSSKRDAEELRFGKRAIILVALIASSGRSGFEILLRNNFLELIVQLLAFEMDEGTTQHSLCQHRIGLIREALILLNRLASHPSYSLSTLRGLTRSKAAASLTVDVANRLPRSSRALLAQCRDRSTVSGDLVHLSLLFRLRIYSFLGVSSS